MNKYPCNACAKRERCTGGNYQRCQKWRAWFHDHWAGLYGAEEREKYKVWLDLMIRRSSWRRRRRNETD